MGTLYTSKPDQKNQIKKMFGTSGAIKIQDICTGGLNDIAPVTSVQNTMAATSTKSTRSRNNAGPLNAIKQALTQSRVLNKGSFLGGHSRNKAFESLNCNTVDGVNRSIKGRDNIFNSFDKLKPDLSGTL